VNKLIIIGILVFAFGKCDFLRANTITIESIDSLNDVCFDVGKSDPEASFQMASDILQRAENLGYVGGQMTALCRMGRAVYKRNKLDSALYYYDLSEKLFSRKGSDSIFLAKTYVYQGLVNKKMGNLDLAASKYQAAYYVAKSAGNVGLMSSCLINSSNIYITKEEFKEAHILLNDALRSFSPDNLEKIGLVHLSKGNIFDLQERYQDANEAYKKALVCFQKTLDSLGIAKSLLNLGNIFLKTDQPDSARYYYDQTHTIAEEHDFHGILAKTYQNKGEHFYQANSIDSAFIYFTKSIESNELSGSVADLSLAYERLGDIYLLRGSFAESLNNYLVAFNSSEDLSDYSQLKDLTYKISASYSADIRIVFLIVRKVH